MAQHAANGARKAHWPVRGRGQPVLEKLSSTDDFTHRAALSLVDRKLILFLIVMLVDGKECLTTTYNAIIKKYSGVPGHWAYGKNLDTLRKECAKHLGKGAQKRPGWPQIVDTVTAALKPQAAAEVLAIAAGLFCESKGIDRPEGYQGDIRRPAWSAANVKIVTVEMLRAPEDAVPDLPQPGERAETQSPAEQIATLQAKIATLQAELAAAKAEKTLLRANLDTVTRAFRVRDRDACVAEHAAHQQWSDSKALCDRARTISTELDQVREDNAALRDRMNGLAAAAHRGLLQVLQTLHPIMSADVWQRLMMSVPDSAIGTEDTSDSAIGQEMGRYFGVPMRVIVIDPRQPRPS